MSTILTSHTVIELINNSRIEQLIPELVLCFRIPTLSLSCSMLESCKFPLCVEQSHHRKCWHQLALDTICIDLGYCVKTTGWICGWWQFIPMSHNSLGRRMTLTQLASWSTEQSVVVKYLEPDDSDLLPSGVHIWTWWQHTLPPTSFGQFQSHSIFMSLCK